MAAPRLALVSLLAGAVAWATAPGLAEAAKRVLYINFDGAMLTPGGDDDSANNITQMPQFAGAFPPYGEPPGGTRRAGSCPRRPGEMRPWAGNARGPRVRRTIDSTSRAWRRARRVSMSENTPRRAFGTRK